MLYKVFSVYDSKAEAYLQPFFSPTAGQAVRMFQDAVGDSNHQFAKHAADYTLFEIGGYDDHTGILTAREGKIPLGCAIEYVVKPKSTQEDLPL